VVAKALLRWLIEVLLWHYGWWLEVLLFFVGGCQGDAKVVARVVAIVL